MDRARAVTVDRYGPSKSRGSYDPSAACASVDAWHISTSERLYQAKINYCTPLTYSLVALVRMPMGIETLSDS